MFTKFLLNLLLFLNHFSLIYAWHSVQDPTKHHRLSTFVLQSKQNDARELRKQVQANKAMNLPKQPLVRTLEGGTSTLFQQSRQQSARWHPSQPSCSNSNSSRTKTPKSLLWKSARKNRPSLWRYAVRQYDQLTQQQKELHHHQAALVACSKLGNWQRALTIYQVATAAAAAIDDTTRREHLLQSLIRACVRAARRDRLREPLDTAVAIVLEYPHAIARHWNPLAAAYQSLGHTQQARQLLLTHLSERTSGPEGEDGFDSFNIYDVTARDKASYSLLVQAAVQEGDWAGAVGALHNMTQAGLYPTSRHLNAWTEVSRGRRRKRKKKRQEDCWLNGFSTHDN